ncbi:hypothetical protein P8452_46603 [Trifolium repens]|nr:hypothetical protein P8452_46603 [Trifolium repens]
MRVRSVFDNFDKILLVLGIIPRICLIIYILISGFAVLIFLISGFVVIDFGINEHHTGTTKRSNLGISNGLTVEVQPVPMALEQIEPMLVGSDQMGKMTNYHVFFNNETNIGCGMCNCRISKIPGVVFVP